VSKFPAVFINQRLRAQKADDCQRAMAGQQMDRDLRKTMDDSAYRQQKEVANQRQPNQAKLIDVRSGIVKISFRWPSEFLAGVYRGFSPVS
jgi:hypothetical protein